MDPSLAVTLQLLGVVLLVALNAFFVAAEFALVTVRWTRIEALVNESKFGAKALAYAAERIDDSLAAAQLGITVASLALGWVGEPALAHLIEPVFEKIPGPWGAAVTHGAAIFVTFNIITYLHVVLGEQVPKVIAIERAEDVGLWVAAPLTMFARVTAPLTALIRNSSSGVIKLLHMPDLPAHKEVHSIEELRMLVDQTEEAGIIPEDQADWVENVFLLSNKKVRDVMVPRDKVVGLPLEATEDEVLDVARRHAHTRMPVWDDSQDNIVGIVNTKDLFHLFSLRGLVVLMDAMYPALFVSPDESVAKVLQTLKRQRRPMAVVRDKQGRFAGMVTLEDIVEEIVGEIEDEHDDPRRAADRKSRRLAITRARLVARARHLGGFGRPAATTNPRKPSSK